MYEPTTAEQLHTVAPAAGTQPLSEAQAAAEAARLIAESYSSTGPVATSYKDIAPLPTTGDAVPWPQPGRPPMSQKATDASALMLSGGVATALVGGTASLVMVASGSADPVVCAIVVGAPTALVLALSRLVGRVKATVEAAPPTHHHHYNAPVRQETTNVSSTTKGLLARNRNDIR
ncbi:hypothetical protein OHA19_10515 [Streptomyces sp. NBC_00012]|uniref:hypothetical protein n=1 Tax=Streptomyces sp. NBC_00012 TaxID=2975621 RepID=UPI003253BA7A